VEQVLFQPPVLFQLLISLGHLTLYLMHGT
jgi:hypothetical protein